MNYNTFSNNLENNIELFVGLSILITFLYKFLSACNLYKKYYYKLDSNTNEYDIYINRPSYIFILLNLVSYSQFISLLSFYDISKFPKLLTVSKKLDWINLWNIDIVDVNDSHCLGFNFYFQNHFVFLIILMSIIFLNIFVLYLFKFFYKKIIKKNSELHQIYGNDKNILIILMENFMLFPYTELAFIHYAIGGLLISNISILNTQCEDLLIISLSSLLVTSSLYFSYYIAFIKNKILSFEDIIYKKKELPEILYNQDIIPIFRDNSLISKNRWIIKKDIKYYKSHSYIFIDFKQKELSYLYFNLLKIFCISFITGLQPNISNENNDNSFYSLISLVCFYIIDLGMLIGFYPYKNFYYNLFNLLVNSLILALLILILFVEKEKYIIYLIDSTFILLFGTLFIELFSRTLYNGLIYYKKNRNY